MAICWLRLRKKSRPFFSTKKHISKRLVGNNKSPSIRIISKTLLIVKSVFSLEWLEWQCLDKPQAGTNVEWRWMNSGTLPFRRLSNTLASVQIKHMAWLLTPIKANKNNKNTDSFHLLIKKVFASFCGITNYSFSPASSSRHFQAPTHKISVPFLNNTHFDQI